MTSGGKSYIKGIGWFLAGVLVAVPVLGYAWDPTTQIVSGQPVKADAIRNNFNELKTNMDALLAWKASWDKTAGIPADRISVFGNFQYGTPITETCATGGICYVAASACPAGYFAISGNCHGEQDFKGGATPGRAHVFVSVQSPLNSWTCYFQNFSGAAATVSVRSLCLKQQ